MCIELQSVFPDYQFALGGRLIGIACGSIGLVRKILVCGASGILGNSSFICFFLALHVETTKNWFARFWYAVHPECWETIIVFGD